MIPLLSGRYMLQLFGSSFWHAAIRPAVLDDIAPPNLYTLRGPRRVGKSTVLKQTVSRLIASGVDPRPICFFAVGSLVSFQDIFNLFQTARLLLPDLGDAAQHLIDEVQHLYPFAQEVRISIGLGLARLLRERHPCLVSHRLALLDDPSDPDESPRWPTSSTNITLPTESTHVTRFYPQREVLNTLEAGRVRPRLWTTRRWLSSESPAARLTL